MISGESLSRTGSDEIDLVELFRSLWVQKWLIAGATAACGCLAAAYAFLATPVYEVQSLLRPALVKDLDELNGTGIYELSAKSALQRVGASLDSYETRLGFFHANTQLFEQLAKPDVDLDKAFAKFSREEFTMLRPDPKKPEGLSEYVGIQIAYPDYLDGVAITNGLVAYAINLEKQRVAEDFEVVVANRLEVLDRKIKQQRASYEATRDAQIAQYEEKDAIQRAELQDELKALRLQLRTKRLNRIAQLEEAIGIAKSLGIYKPTTPAAMGEEGKVALGQGSVIRTEVNNQQIPLYFMGVETLQAERDALKARRSDDFTEPRIAEIAKTLNLLEHNRSVEAIKKRANEHLFLKALATLREEEARLKELDMDFAALNIVRVDQPAVQPLKPVKPKKLLVILIGFVLGGMLGVFAALMRVVLEKQQSS